MQKNLLIVLLITVLFIVTSCSNNQEQEVVFLDVQLSVTPEKLKIKEKATILANISYGAEQVKDAEVKFEIWRAHDEDHEIIDVKHSENGKYQLEKAFDREGTYYIVSHVNAKSMHNMPKEEFIVGAPSEPEEDESAKEISSEETEHSH